MGSNHGALNRVNAGGHTVWEQFVWFQRFGFVRVQDIVRGGTLVYVLLTAIVTVLTSDLITLAFLGIIAVVALRFASVERYFAPRRRVTIYAEGGLFVAEHLGSGVTRHGQTPEEALANLKPAI